MSFHTARTQSGPRVDLIQDRIARSQRNELWETRDHFDDRPQFVRSAIDHLEKGLKERGAIGVKVAPAHGRFAFLATTKLKPEELVVRLRSGAISEERFVAEMVSLRKAGNGLAPQGIRKDRGGANIRGQE